MLTPDQQKTLFFTTVTTHDAASLKQLIEMNPAFKSEFKKAFQMATDLDVKRLIVSTNLITMINSLTEIKSDSQRLFNQKPAEFKAALLALNEAFEKKLTSTELNQLTLVHPTLNAPPLEDYFQQVKSLIPLVIFLGHIVRGEKAEAETTLKAAENDPSLLKSLLCDRAQVTDYSGRIIEGTALQIAWGADDVSRKAFPEEGMAEMLMEHFRNKLGDSAELEITKQYDEQFPTDNEKEEKARNDRDLVELNKVLQAVAEAKVEVTNYKTKPDAKCQKALDDFREYLKPKGVIKAGKHFNVNLLLEAFNLYDKKFNEFGGSWNSPHNMLFWQQVIGSIQCYLPACYAQAFCQSLYDLVEGGGQKLERSLKFRHGRGIFFPLNSDPSFRLGVEYAAAGDSGTLSGAARGVRSRCKTYIEQKQWHHENLRCSGPEASRLNVGRSSA